ncbi:MAG: type II toxin-antitoxin system HicA family toxin [Verrucomicrobiota bacterium]
MQRAPAGSKTRVGKRPARLVWYACAAQDSPVGCHLERAGFARVHGGKGSHRKFIHPRFPGFVMISGHDGDDAQHYLEKQVPRARKQVEP